MIQKTRKVADHPEFGAFIRQELHNLSIDRESFRSACHMKQSYLEDIKKGSIITKWTATSMF